MGDSPQLLWERCLKYIHEQINNKQHYQTWFSAIKFVNYQDNCLVIQVPNHFVYEILEEQYAKLIHDAIVREFGNGVILQYKIGTQKLSTDNSQSKEGILSTSSNPSIELSIPNRKDNEAGPKESESYQDLDPRLNPNYTFENFIESNCNKLPRSVGMSIAENPNQETFNPLFLFGASGVGKTHLINAIGIKVKENFPQKRVLYVSAHEFIVQYTDSVRRNKFNDFINFYQTIDILIIDDIQEIAGKIKTQMAFFHIFNHLQQNRKQIILSCDRPPAKLEGVEERLLTRFKWGLTAEIKKPDTKLRLDILKSKVRRDGLNFPNNVINYIASKATDNIRDLEGIVNSIMAYSIVYNCDINMELAERVVMRLVNMDKKTITVDLILNKVGAHYGLKTKEICSASRKQNIALARQVTMYLAQKHTGQSYSRIGLFIGKRDHSTVLHSCTVIERRINVDKTFRRELEDIEASLNS